MRAIVVSPLLDPAELAVISDVLAAQSKPSRLLLTQPSIRDLSQALTLRIHQLRDLRPALATYLPKSAENNWFVAKHRDLQIPVLDNSVGSWANPTVKEGIPHIEAKEAFLASCFNLRLQIDDCSAGNIEFHYSDGSSESPDVDEGSGLLFSPLTVHSSAKLSSGSGKRRVLQILYGPPELPEPYRWYSHGA